MSIKCSHYSMYPALLHHIIDIGKRMAFSSLTYIIILSLHIMHYIHYNNNNFSKNNK